LEPKEGRKDHQREEHFGVLGTTAFEERERERERERKRCGRMTKSF
jgi:hypothetical protein